MSKTAQCWPVICCFKLLLSLSNIAIADLLMLLLSPKMPDGLNEHTSCANTAVQGIWHQKSSKTITKIIHEIKKLISRYKTNFTCNLYKWKVKKSSWTWLPDCYNCTKPIFHHWKHRLNISLQKWLTQNFGKKQKIESETDHSKYTKNELA